MKQIARGHWLDHSVKGKLSLEEKQQTQQQLSLTFKLIWISYIDLLWLFSFAGKKQILEGFIIQGYFPTHSLLPFEENQDLQQ